MKEKEKLNRLNKDIKLEKKLNSIELDKKILILFIFLKLMLTLLVFNLGIYYSSLYIIKKLICKKNSVKWSYLVDIMFYEFYF